MQYFLPEFFKTILQKFEKLGIIVRPFNYKDISHQEKYEVFTIPWASAHRIFILPLTSTQRYNKVDSLGKNLNMSLRW
jgi:hypothetical protein